jgi:Na+/proline symporter
LAYVEVAVPAGVADLLKLYEIVPGFIMSLIVIVVVSLLTRAPSDAVAEQHDALP